MSDTLFPMPSRDPSLDPSMRCHRDDPPTSFEAAERAIKSGTTAEHRALILDVLSRAKVPMTASEIGAVCGLTQVEVNRRMSEIPAAQPCEARICTFRKSRCTTYKMKETTT